MVNLAFVSGLVSFIVFLGQEVFSRPVTGMFFAVFFREIFNLPETQNAIYHRIPNFSSRLTGVSRSRQQLSGVEEFIELYYRSKN